MPAPEPTSKPTPARYIAGLNEPRRSDVRRLHAFVRTTVPGLKPFMLSGEIIGYGPYHYRYASGREGDSAVVALSSRKQYLSLYVCAVIDGQYVAERYKAKLPKADVGKSCIRVKHADDLEPDVLRNILLEAAAWAKGQRAKSGA